MNTQIRWLERSIPAAPARLGVSVGRNVRVLQYRNWNPEVEEWGEWVDVPLVLGE